MLSGRLLGSVEVSFDDKRIDLGFPRQRVLLAMLLVEVNRLVTVDSLIDRIWTDRPPARASHALYADVSKLRRALAPASGLCLIRQTGGYQIQADPATIDMHRFRALRSRAHSYDNDEDTAVLLDEALALWRGEAFADVDNPWLTALRRRLNGEKLAMIIDRNDACLRLGRHTHLLTDLADVSATHPLDERLAAQYMLALYRCARPTDALTHYHHTRGLLAEELGVDPGPALRELHEQVLRHDPQLLVSTPTTLSSTGSNVGSPPVRTDSAVSAAAVVPFQLPADTVRFTGRAKHLTHLLDLTPDPDGSGGPVTVVVTAVEGMAGIGKPEPGL